MWSTHASASLAPIAAGRHFEIESRARALAATRMRRLASLAVLVGCTSSAPAPAPVEAPPPVVAPAVPTTPAQPHAHAPYWQWDEPVDTAATGVVTPGGRYRVTAKPALVLEKFDPNGRLLFARTLPDAAHHDTAVMAADGAAIYVAHHSAIATGTVLTRIDGDTGDIRWSRALIGAGPIAHSQYTNRVALEIVDGRAVVFGNEASGQYTEIVDPQDGHTVAHGVPRPTFLGAAAEFLERAPPERDASTVVLDSEGGSFRFTEARRDGGEAALRRDGASPWMVALRGRPHCGQAALREIGDTLWVVRWCDMASGADVVAVDPATGGVRVERPLRALPNVVHSKYRASVELRELDGHPVVFGFESAGRYVEVLDPATAATVVSRTRR